MIGMSYSYIIHNKIVKIVNDKSKPVLDSLLYKCWTLMSFTKINITHSYSNMGNSFWNAQQNAWQERDRVGRSIYLSECWKLNPRPHEFYHWTTSPDHIKSYNNLNLDSYRLFFTPSLKFWKLHKMTRKKNYSSFEITDIYFSILSRWEMLWP